MMMTRKSDGGERRSEISHRQQGELMKPGFIELGSMLENSWVGIFSEDRWKEEEEWLLLLLSPPPPGGRVSIANW